MTTTAADRPATGAPRGPATAAPAIGLAVLSLGATADMALGYPVVPAPVWLAVLLAVAIACAFVTRRAATTGRRALAHPALEPFAMALMVALSLLHAHGAPATASIATASITSGPHDHGSGLLTVALGLAVAALGAGCLLGAVRAAVAHGLLRAALPVIAAGAMCVMTVWMLLPR